MTKEQWESCQRLIDAGLIETVLPSLINEFETRLSSEQLALLGDVKPLLRSFPAKSKHLTIRNLVDCTIDMVQKGAITGVRD